MSSEYSEQEEQRPDGARRGVEPCVEPVADEDQDGESTRERVEGEEAREPLHARGLSECATRAPARATGTKYCKEVWRQALMRVVPSDDVGGEGAS